MGKRRFLWISGGLLALGLTFVAGYAVGFLTFQPVMGWYFARGYEKKQAKFLNEVAPDFESTAVDGGTFRLSDRRGTIVVVDFMASWCAPCVGSYPILKRIHERFGADGQVVVVGVALDEDRKALAAHLETYAVPWPTLFESGKGWKNSVAQLYEIHGIPSVWVIDRDGRVVALDSSSEQAERVVETLLASGEHEAGAND